MTLPELNLGLLRAKPVVTPRGENQLIKLVLIGCGGTGSWLAGGLARVAWELKRMGRQVEVQFWDFDRVEPQNVPRHYVDNCSDLDVFEGFCFHFIHIPFLCQM